MAPSPSRLRVDVATGATHLDAVDFVLPGPIPLALTRHYASASAPDLAHTSLGAGWRLGLDVELAITDDRIACHGGPFDGAAFAPVATGRAALQEATGLTIEHVSDAYTLSASPRRQLVFLKRHAQGDRIPLAAVRDGSGQILHIERRGRQIAEVRDPLGRVVRFTLRGDAVESLDLVAPGSQPVTVARYNYAGGTLRSAAGPDGRAEQFDDEGGFVTSHRSRAGGQTFAQYAEDGRCLALWSDARDAVHLAYDDLRQATRVLDASGGQTIYRRVGGLQVLERIDPGGASHTYHYDEAGRLIGHGNAAGVRAFQRLDPAEHRLAHLDREERVAFVQYHENGLAAAAEDAFDNTWAFRWDETHALTGLTTPEGDTWTFGRDENARVTSIASPMGRMATLTWERNRLTVEDAEGTRWRESTDAFGRVVERVDRSGRREHRRYGPDGHLAEVRIDDYAVETLFDADGRLVGTADSERRRVRIDRDAAGQITSETDASGRTVRLERDATGRIAAATDGQGDPLHLAYDADGRLAALSGRIEATYAYSSGDTTIHDAAGARRYTFAGDLAEWTRADGERETVQTGPSGNLLSWEHTRGGDTLGALYPAFDASGRLATLSGQRAVGDGSTADVTARLVYDRDGLLTELHDATGPTVTVTPDALGRPVELAGYDAPVRLSYDAADRIASVDAEGARIELAYDALDRVVAVRRGETTVDLRTDEDAVVSEVLARRTPSPPEASEDRWARRPPEPVASSLSIRAERRGVVLLAHLGPLAVPIRVQAERRCPPASATAQQLACAIRGPEAVLPPVAEGEALVALWSPDAHRSLQLDHTAVPRARDLGLASDALDGFFLDAAHLDAVPVTAGAAPMHQLDAARGPNDALTGPHRRGGLRPAPWRERSSRALLPPHDLLAPDGAPSARDVIDFVRRHA